MSEIRRFTLMQGWRGGNCVGDTAGGLVHYDDHLAVVDDAVLAERERCAELVSRLHLDSADHACYSEFDHNRIVSVEVEIKRGVVARGEQAKSKGKVTKAHLFDATKIEVENIAPEGGVTLHPQPKFKVGDRVTWSKKMGEGIISWGSFNKNMKKWEYDCEDSNWFCLWENDLTLYVAPLTTCGCPGGYVKKATATATALQEEAGAYDHGYCIGYAAGYSRGISGVGKGLGDFCQVDECAGCGE